jgi:predicted CopG family antitoxin
MKIGNQSFSDDLIEILKGKTEAEILELRPHLHPKIVKEFVKEFPAKKKTESKKKTSTDKE